MADTRLDPFREMDRLAEHLLGTARNAAAMPMDLYRTEDEYVLSFDLPGVDPGSIDVSVENQTLTVKARRDGGSEEKVQWLARERALGTYARQLNLGEGMALDKIDATYADGVLTLTIPVAEQARPRRIEVTRGGSARSIEAGGSEPTDVRS